MKKSTKNILLVGVISFSIGLVLCAIAACFGVNGAFASLVDSGRLVGFNGPYTWFRDNDFFWDEASWGDWDSLDGTVISSGQKGEDIAIASGGEIKNLEIECGAAKIVIDKSADKEIHVINNSNTKVKYKQNGESLHIMCKGRTNNTGTIELYLPRDMALDDMEIDLGAGVIENNIALKITNLNVDVGAGEVRLEEITVRQADFSIGAGQLVVKGNSSIGDMDIDLAAGQFLYEGSISNEVDIDVAMGQAVLNLDDREENYTTDVSIGAGNVTLGNRNLSAAMYDGSFGDGEKELNLDCSMGNITVTFEND